MHFSTLLLPLFSILSLTHAAASPITSSRITSIVASITNQNVITIPKDALAAFNTLAVGGKLKASELAAVSKCVAAARANNENSKINIGCSVQNNIIFDTNKLALHACEGASISNQPDSTALKLLVSNAANLNTELSHLKGGPLPKLTILA